MTNRSRWMLPVGLSLVTWITLSLATPAPPQAGGPIGTNFCGPAIPNSTGLPAVMSANGSQLVADNDVTLFASQLPPGQFGYFLVSRTQGYFYIHSCGSFCLYGDIGRFRGPGQVGVGPTISVQIDLNNLPTNALGSQQTMPGETLNFQAWYRDIGNTNNFSDGLEITFL